MDYKREWVIMDLSWHMYRSAYSFGFMTSNVDGFNKPTGHIFGVLSSIQEILKRNPEATILLCEDGRPQGKLINADYKAGREKLAYNIMQDRETIERLACLHPNVRVAYNENEEADHVMFTLARRGDRANVQVTVFSGDNDLVQALSDNVSIYRGKTKEGKDYWITAEDYMEREDMTKKFHMVRIDALPIFRALVGDSSDNLRGVERIPRDLAKYLAENWPPYVEKIQDRGLAVWFTYNNSPLFKASYNKYVEALSNDINRIEQNIRIMKLYEVKVEQRLGFDPEQAKNDIEALKLNKWKTFLEEVL